MSSRVKRLLASSCYSIVVLSIAAPIYAQSCQSPTPVWADEFDGNALDTTKWDPQTGDGCAEGICGWGNQELQSYKAENATVSNGTLKITAKSERVRGKKYTSARLRTANMSNGGQWTNGRFEARIKIPDGAGMWPAFWMLPTDPDVGWPVSGEIDIMESTGAHPENVFGTIHYGNPYPNNEFSGNNIRVQPGTWADDFHVYALEWTPNGMRWYVDDILYSTKTLGDLSDPAFWTFENYQYHFLLNLAVGGTLGGDVDDSALPQVLEVDYVRVYDFGQPALLGPNIAVPNAPATYSVVSEIGTNSTYSWSAPTGESGNGSDFTVNWGENGGSVNVTVNNSCGTRDLSMDVHVLPAVVQETVLDNFGGTSNLTYTTIDGTLNSPAANPSADSVNPSTSVGEYTRNSASLYDVIAGDTSVITDASLFETGDKAFYLDVYTDAPTGTEILVQLENSNVATPDNYPGGRHSKYVAYTGTQNAWQRLRFTLQERIDGATGDNAVDSVILLIAPGTNTGDTYYLDNFDIYGPDTGGPQNSPPTAVFSENCSDLTCGFTDGSSDSDGSILSWDWDFGDGNNSASQNPTHSFSAAGTYTVSLTVTDDDGATDTASADITVTDGNTGGNPTSISVSAVETGTQGAGRGAKYGTATVTVTDDLGNPVDGASVSGDFSGTFTESVSGMTDGNGQVSFQTSSTAGGKVNVNFCVSSLNGSLPHDTSASTGLCQ